MSQRAMADIAGVSVATVSRRIKALGAGVEPVKRPTYADTDPDADRLSRLEELRDMLYEAMKETRGGSLAQLSKEYRATLVEIELAEGGGESDQEDDDPIAELIRRRESDG